MLGGYSIDGIGRQNHKFVALQGNLCQTHSG
jgi:hypothetical protein